MMQKHDFLIIDAGFATAVSAQKLAERGHRVLLIDKQVNISSNVSSGIQIDKRRFELGQCKLCTELLERGSKDIL